MHLNMIENRASGPTNPATQMAADAIAHMTEDTRLELAMGIINQAEQSASIATLMRISAVAKETSCAIQANRMVDEIAETSNVDAAFMRIFVSHYNRRECPTFMMAYRHAQLEVSAQKLTCHVLPSDRVRRALKTYHCGNRVGA